MVIYREIINLLDKSLFSDNLQDVLEYFLFFYYKFIAKIFLEQVHRCRVRETYRTSIKARVGLLFNVDQDYLVSFNI